jgi:hypothetical protein
VSSAISSSAASLGTSVSSADGVLTQATRGASASGGGVFEMGGPAVRA